MRVHRVQALTSMTKEGAILRPLAKDYFVLRRPKNGIQRGKINEKK